MRVRVICCIKRRTVRVLLAWMERKSSVPALSSGEVAPHRPHHHTQSVTPLTVAVTTPVVQRLSAESVHLRRESGEKHCDAYSPSYLELPLRLACAAGTGGGAATPGRRAVARLLSHPARGRGAGMGEEDDRSLVGDAAEAQLGGRRRKLARACAMLCAPAATFHRPTRRCVCAPAQVTKRRQVSTVTIGGRAGKMVAERWTGEDRHEGWRERPLRPRPRTSKFRINVRRRCGRTTRIGFGCRT